jgi:hypothetical protein
MGMAPARPDNGVSKNQKKTKKKPTTKKNLAGDSA